MSDVKCARMLSSAATRNLDALQVMFRSDEVSDEVFDFHVQQAAEKLLEAWIALLGEVYPLTHNIEELLKILADRDAVAGTGHSALQMDESERRWGG